MAEDRQLRAVVALAQAMAAAHTPRESWRAAAVGACSALAGSFAALSVWERDRGRLRVLVNAGDRAPDEEEFPEAETYPVNRFPEITEFLHERWAGGGEPDAWVESVDGPLLPEPGEEFEPHRPGWAEGGESDPPDADADAGAGAGARTDDAGEPLVVGQDRDRDQGQGQGQDQGQGQGRGRGQGRGSGPGPLHAADHAADLGEARPADLLRKSGPGPAEGAATGPLWPGHELRADPFAPRDLALAEGSEPPPWDGGAGSEAGAAPEADRHPPLAAEPGQRRQLAARGYRHPSLPPGPTGPQARVAALRRRRRGCCVVAPIVLHGRAWGELYVARPLGAPVFDREDADFATVLASVIASGIAQTERLEEVRRLAFTDPLTGLANRRAVDTRLDEALERHREDGSVVSLVVCDLNGLKQVNDTLGHAVGDRLLERFGSVLSLCGALLPGALVARLGGDEFCLVSVGPSADEVVRVAGELCVRAADMDLGEGVACGVASTGDPIGQVRSARRLFRLADAAQYRAKAARSPKPVVAGRDGHVLQLADTPPRPQHQPERRRFRGMSPDDAHEPWSEP